MSKRDYYDVLGLSRDSSAAEIKTAYRRAAQKYHPDRNDGDKESEEKFKEAKEAYEVLSDTQVRSRYDRFGHANDNHNSGHGATGGPSFDDIINAARSAFHGGVTTNIRQQVGVPIDIMLNGGSINISIMVPESTGQYGQVRLNTKSVTINIKKDTAPGSMLNETIDGNKLAFVVIPQSAKGFFAHGVDVVKKIDVSVFDAIAGTTIEFIYLDGTTLRGNVPPNTKTETPLRIAGRGLSHTMGGRGDLIVVVNHVLPKLNEEQLKLVKELAEKLK